MKSFPITTLLLLVGCQTASNPVETMGAVANRLARSLYFEYGVGGLESFRSADDRDSWQFTFGMSVDRLLGPEPVDLSDRTLKIFTALATRPSEVGGTPQPSVPPTETALVPSTSPLFIGPMVNPFALLGVPVGNPLLGEDEDGGHLHHDSHPEDKEKKEGGGLIFETGLFNLKAEGVYASLGAVLILVVAALLFFYLKREGKLPFMGEDK